MSNLLPENLPKFNWGAALCAPWWCFFHGKITQGIALFVLMRFQGKFHLESEVLFILFSTIIIWRIILGFNGYKIAWNLQKFDTVEKLKTNQNKWAVAGAIIEIIGLLVATA